MGSMQVDYGALVWQQRLALSNVPTGSTRLVLSASDLGNFMTHPIFKQVAAHAIHVSGALTFFATAGWAGSPCVHDRGVHA